MVVEMVRQVVVMAVMLMVRAVVVVSGGVALLLVWRSRLKNRRPPTPPRIYMEKTWDVPAVPEKRKRHRRSDKDTTIKAVVPLSELALMGVLRDASGAFVRPTAGKTKGEKKESAEQRRKRERRELIAATRSQVAEYDPHRRSERNGTAEGRSVPSRVSPERYRERKSAAGGGSHRSRARRKP